MPHKEVPLPRHAAQTVTHGGQAGAELAALLPEITGPGGQFRHRQHIHLAFLAVRRYGMPEATTRICDWIQRIAVYERAPQKYHHTVSRAWVEIVAHHVGADPDCADFGTFADRHPALLDKRLLSQALPVLHPGRRPGAESAGSSRTSCRSPGRPVRTAGLADRSPTASCHPAADGQPQPSRRRPAAASR